MRALVSTLLTCLALQTAIAAPTGKPAPLATALDSSNIISTATGLVLVLVLIFGLAWLAKRYMQLPSLSKGQIQVLGSVSLGTRERAVLISVGGERLLLGVAPGQVRRLHVLTSQEGENEADPEQPDAGESFASTLESAEAEIQGSDIQERQL